MAFPKVILLLILLLGLMGEGLRAAPKDSSDDFEQSTEGRIASLESKVHRLETSLDRAVTSGLLAFLFGAFCALWAQNSARNPWLWFFLGSLFSVGAVIVVLLKNSNSKKPKRPRTFAEGRKLAP